MEMVQSEYLVSPTSPTLFGNIPLPSAANVDGHLRVYQEQLKDDVYVPIWQVLPINIVVGEGERMNQTCTSFYLECRQLLSAGATAEEVIGDDVLDVTGLAEPNALPDSHKFTQWAIGFLMTFGETTWDFRIASAYCLFHLMRVCPLYYLSRYSLDCD